MIRKILSNKELIWTILYQASVLFGGLLLIKLLAVSLSKNDYGYYALITSISAFVLMMPFTAFMQGISRYLSIYTKKNKINEFYTNIIFIFVSLVIFYLIISLVLKYFISDAWNEIYFFIVLFIFSEIFKTLFYTINNANRKRKSVAISSILEFSMKSIIIYLSYKYKIIDISYTLMALIGGNILATIVSIYANKSVFLFNHIEKKNFRIYFSRIWIFSYPLLIWAIFGWLRDMSNRWYLDYFLDKESVALFAMMGSLALIAPVALQGIIGSFFIPILYQKENNEKGYTRRFLKIMLPSVLGLFLISFVITYYFKDFIILLIADEKYLEISWMLPWMFLVYSFYVLAMMSTYELFAHKQTKKLIVSSIVPGVISLICGYFLIKEYGINGALVNYAITYGSYSLFTFIVVWNYWRKNDNN